VSDDGARLSVNGRLIIDNNVDQGRWRNAATVEMTADQKYELKLEYHDTAARRRWRGCSGHRTASPRRSGSFFFFFFYFFFFFFPIFFFFFFISFFFRVRAALTLPRASPHRTQHRWRLPTRPAPDAAEDAGGASGDR
jgi:hypothetical protein